VNFTLHARCSLHVLCCPAYDSDKLDGELRQYGIELIAPHRWKIERLNFRRLVVRYERYAENFLRMLYLGCCLILLRRL
jgi:transposase